MVYAPCQKNFATFLRVPNGDSAMNYDSRSREQEFHHFLFCRACCVIRVKKKEANWCIATIRNAQGKIVGNGA